jgi:uncharacterized protein with PIN domain
MLMRLGRWLRLLGLDVANPRDASDIELLEMAKKDHRTLITRDRRLEQSCRAARAGCILIKSSSLEEQLREMKERGIPLQLNPQRCTICNAPLRKVEDMERTTWQCTECKKLYWVGAHWEKMETMLDEIRSRR